jgi:hypothetical protein
LPSLVDDKTNRCRSRHIDIETLGLTGYYTPAHHGKKETNLDPQRS